MIYYFSGTGNTRHAAQLLSKYTGLECRPFSVGMLRKPQCARVHIPDGQPMVLMFPVYAWGIPRVVSRLLSHCNFDCPEDIPAWMVCTCGDDIGTTASQWRRLMKQMQFRPMGAFSITMPNTYVSLKGFDVDTPEVEKAKLEAVDDRVRHIAEVIKKGNPVADEVTPGKYPWAKSHILRPLFNAFLTSPHKFYTTDDCTACGLCISSCPMENIIPGEGRRPAWGNHCADCLRCYHICPHRAVRFGSQTDGKGQYRHFLSGTL